MNEEQRECFAHNLKVGRFLKQWSQVELAKAAGIAPLSKIGSLEEQRAMPKLNEFISICKVLGQPMDEMISKKAKITVEFL